MELPNRWRGELVPLDVPTGDQRIIASPQGELKTRPMPIPLIYQELTGDAHDGSYVIGNITRAWIETGPDGNRALWGEGTFDLNDRRSAGMVRRIAEGWQPWVSVRLDSTTEAYECRLDGDPVQCPTAAGEEDDGTRTYSIATDWRLMNAAVVAEPAFETSRITQTWRDESNQETGSAQPECRCDNRDNDDREDLEVDWDEDFGPHWGYSQRQTPAFAVSDVAWGEVSQADYSPEQWRRATLIHLEPAEGQDADAKELHKLPVRMPGGAVNRNAVHAAASVLAGGRGGVEAPAEDKAKAARALVRLYRGTLKEDPPESLLKAANMTAAAAPPHTADLVYLMTASGDRWMPEAGWFTDPELGQYTRVTITQDGRVFGHVADWNAEHIGFQGQKIRPPRSRTNYAWFKRRAIELSDGTTLRVGMITFGPGHKDANGNPRAAIQHYDATCAQGALVAVGEDAHGIWVAGSILPHLQVPDRNALSVADLSGDWRLDNGSLEMVGAHCVNLPGFLNTTDEQGRSLPLVAAAEATSGTWVHTNQAGKVLAMFGIGMRPRPPADAGSPQPKSQELGARVHAARVRMAQAAFTAEYAQGDYALVGNSARLKRYWKTGEGGAKIRWGTEGDLTRCHRLVSKEVEPGEMDVWGYCQNLHKELFGRPNPRD